MIVVQLLGVVLLALGLLFLAVEIGGKRITESQYLGISGPVGLVLIPVGVVIIILG